jgi:uncharacterized membrane protein
MSKNRLETFSDGVLAIILTIMVLELKVPHGIELSNILPLWGIFVSYILSFIFITIYWNNHHHLFQAVEHIDGKVMWANANLLFWLSLLPFVSGFMGENHFAPLPVLLYAIVTFMAGLAYTILTKTLTKIHDENSIINKAQKESKKGIISLVLYFSAVCIAYFSPIVSCAIFVAVAIMWFIPSKKIENEVRNTEQV